MEREEGYGDQNETLNYGANLELNASFRPPSSTSGESERLS